MLTNLDFLNNSSVELKTTKTFGLLTILGFFGEHLNVSYTQPHPTQSDGLTCYLPLIFPCKKINMFIDSF